MQAKGVSGPLKAACGGAVKGNFICFDRVRDFQELLEKQDSQNGFSTRVLWIGSEK